MDTYALIKNGTVINIVRWDGNTDLWQPDPGVQAVLDTGAAQIGGTWDGVNFHPAPPVLPPVPEKVTRFQGKAALAQAGYLDTVEAMMADPLTPAVSRLAWTDAPTFERDSQTVIGMGGALGLTSEQLDDLFRLAATITA